MIRTATSEDLTKVLNWAAEEGWNPGQDDVAPFLSSDPKGFFVAEAAGVPVASISVVNHSAEFAFLGLYICRPEHRGKGIGYALWQAALLHAGNRTIGLDGVAAQQANYAKSGFVPAGATRRLCGKFDRQEGRHDDLRPVNKAVIPALLGLDKQAFGIKRLAFITSWLAGSHTRRSVSLFDHTGPRGFATARLCREGCKIGPVVAPDVPSALRLAQAAASAVQCTDVILDVPETESGFDLSLRQLGFAETFATARMYKGPAPKSHRTGFAVATLELG